MCPIPFYLASYRDQAHKCLSPNGTLAIVCDKDDLSTVGAIVKNQPGLYMHHDFYYAVSRWSTDNRRKIYQQAMVPVVMAFTFPPFTTMNLNNKARDDPQFVAYLFDFLGEIPCKSEWFGQPALYSNIYGYVVIKYVCIIPFNVTASKQFPIHLSDDVEKTVMKGWNKSSPCPIFKKIQHSPLPKEFLELVCFLWLIIFRLGLFIYICCGNCLRQTQHFIKLLNFPSLKLKLLEKFLFGPGGDSGAMRSCIKVAEYAGEMSHLGRCTIEKRCQYVNLQLFPYFRDQMEHQLYEQVPKKMC